MHIFISHSRVNASSAYRLCETLQSHGVGTWLDMRDLEPGSEWKEGVNDAIKQAAGFVFLIGPDISGDRWQTYEWQQVVNEEIYLDPLKPLIPVLIGEPELPGFLRTRQAVALDNSAGSFESVAQAILGVLKNPSSSVDEKKVALGREAQRQARSAFQEYSKAVAENEINQSAIRALE